MSRVLKFVILILVLGMYCGFFLFQEKLYSMATWQLKLSPPAAIVKVASGYLYQIAAEYMFVQSAVFLGGVEADTSETTYTPILAHNYKQITDLYPEFTDPYYFAQAYLASAGPEYSRIVNKILDTGRRVYPENLIFAFFQGFNLFSYLSNPLEAAETFNEASKLPEAPPMFGHLAIILKAEGGQLEAAKVSLALLIKNSENDAEKHRYKNEMKMFDSALEVQEAVHIFKEQHGRFPVTLEELVPHYIEKIPEFGSSFILIWEPPTVGLKRPSK